MSLAQQFDIGRYIHGTAALAPVTINSSAGAAQSGITIDRQAYGRGYHSASILAAVKLTGSTVQAVAVAVAFEHSSDGSSWDSYSTGSNVSKAIGSTGATGAQAVNDVVNAPVNLAGARRYVRAVVTPTFSATSSGDTAALAAIAALGGADELPATS
jgi:hypothetical protein